MRPRSSFRPLIRGLSISSPIQVVTHFSFDVSVPSSGDYQFLLQEIDFREIAEEFPSPHPGIINFFMTQLGLTSSPRRFRPLIRGLSISSPLPRAWERFPGRFPSPHPGIINFFESLEVFLIQFTGFRPLIRGLSISSSYAHSAPYLQGTVSVPSSGDYQFLRCKDCCINCSEPVSVPSSGDYQFLLTLKKCQCICITSFRPLIRGLSISSYRELD